MTLLLKQFSWAPTRPGLVKVPSTWRSADTDDRASLQSLAATESTLDLRSLTSVHFIKQLFSVEMMRRTDDLNLQICEW